MNGFFQLGRILIVIGIIMVGIGLFFALGSKIPWIGRLPGDIYIKRKNFSFYFPLATSLLISIILTLIFMLFRRK